jgi:hypothetical protein
MKRDLRAVSALPSDADQTTCDAVPAFDPAQRRRAQPFLKSSLRNFESRHVGGFQCVK